MILKYEKFIESVKVTSDVQNQVDKILDKMIDGEELSDSEKGLLKSFKDDNQEEYFDKFKGKIEAEGTLDNLEDGRYFDLVLYSDKFPNVRSTKEVYKVNDNKFELNSTVDGWQTTILDKEEMVKFMIGEIDSLDLDWE